MTDEETMGVILQELESKAARTTRLSEIFAHQRRFMSRFPDQYRGIDFNRQVLPYDDARQLSKMVQDIATCIAQEASELRDWTPWKHWSKQLGNKNGIVPHWSPDHIHEMRVEVADLLCFVVNAAIMLGMDDEQLFDLWRDKAMKNVARQQQGNY